LLGDEFLGELPRPALARTEITRWTGKSYECLGDE
jgi:hypothetical protein